MYVCECVYTHTHNWRDTYADKGTGEYCGAVGKYKLVNDEGGHNAT